MSLIIKIILNISILTTMKIGIYDKFILNVFKLFEKFHKIIIKSEEKKTALVFVGAYNENIVSPNQARLRSYGNVDVFWVGTQK